jgi:hypothetical protein
MRLFDMIKWKLINESVDAEKAFKKLLKQNGITKLPSGTQFKSDRISWSKDGGYAGQKTLDKVCSQLEDAGWKRGEWRTGGIPDGSAVTNSNAYTSPDGQIVMTYSEHFGATAHDNFYGFTFKLAGTGVNESEDMDEWNDDEPKVYKYYSDDPISPKQFVSFVRSMERSIEDIFIQNSDYYENADVPWEEFVNDMCQGKSPEEAFDLDYYMNSPAREQLPDDIAKYVYANDFDAMQWLHGIFERLMPICKDQVDESTITGTGRVDYDDDLVAVYAPDGKVEYKGIFDDCPYKDDDMKYDRETMSYRIEGPRGDYRTMVKLESRMNEASRFGFDVGDQVELTKDKVNSLSGDTVKAGTQGEVVAINKPMPGVIKVKIDGGKVISVPERQLKKAGEDEEPWKKLKKPEEPKRHIRPERPEDYYMRPTSYGSPRFTGD